MLDVLADETTGLEDLDAEASLDTPAQDDHVQVRRLMIRLQQLDRDTAAVAAKLEAVTAAYRQQLDRIDRDRRLLRSTLQAWIELYGTAKFPDVGTAYLAKGDPKVDVVDRDALREELGVMFTKEVFDETAARRYALERALAGDGIPAGVNVVPGGPRLQIRKA